MKNDKIKLVKEGLENKDSRFVFTTNEKKLIQMLKKFQFDRPEIYARELVANSLDSGAENIEIEIGRNWFIIDDDGEGMTPDDIEGYFLSIYNSSRENEIEKIGRFGVGVLSTFASNPYKMIVDTAKNGINTEFYINRKLEMNPLGDGSKKRGTRIIVMKDEEAEDLLENYIKGGKLKRIKSMRKRNSSEEEVIRDYCRYAETPIYVNGEKINEDMDLEGVLLKLKIDEEHMRGIIGIPSRKKKSCTKTKPGTIRGVKGGIFIEDLEGEHYSGLTGIIDYDGFNTVTSRNKIVRDQNFKEFEKRIDEYKKILYTTAMKKSKKISNKKLKNSIKERLAEEAAMNTSKVLDKIKERLHKKKNKMSEIDSIFYDALIEHDLFRSTDGRKLSIYDLYVEIKENGKMPYYTEHKIFTPKTPEKLIILAKYDSPELNVMRNICQAVPTRFNNAGYVVENIDEFFLKIYNPVYKATSAIKRPIGNYKKHLREKKANKKNSKYEEEIIRHISHMKAEVGKKLSYSGLKIKNGLVTTSMLVSSPFVVGREFLAGKAHNYREKRYEKRRVKRDIKMQRKKKREYIISEKLDVTTDYTNSKEITEDERIFLDGLKTSVGSTMIRREIVYSKFRKKSEMMTSTPTRVKINKNHPVIRKMIKEFKDNPTETYLLGTLVLLNHLASHRIWEIEDYVKNLPYSCLEKHKSDFILNPEKYYKRGAEEFMKHFDMLEEKQKETVISNLIGNNKDQENMEPNKEIDRYIEENFGLYIYKDVLYNFE